MPLSVSIQKSTLRTHIEETVARGNFTDADLDRLVAIVGDKQGLLGVSSEDVARQLTPDLPPTQRLRLARAGTDLFERYDLCRILAAPEMLTLLSRPQLQFVRAMSANIETPLDVVLDPTQALANPADASVRAVLKLRSLVETNELNRYYDAAIGAIDVPELKAEALALFAALPAVKPGMTAEALVRAGLWSAAPRHLAEMQKSARYLPGVQLLVETSVKAKVPARNDPGYAEACKHVGEYDPAGVTAITHRATLVGEDPKNRRNYLVKIDGSDVPVPVSKDSVHRLNQPHRLVAANVRGDTRLLPYNGTSWKIDYTSLWAKAKLCEIALRLDPLVAQLDFADQSVSIQQQCNAVIFGAINMLYPTPGLRAEGGRCVQSERDAARQAIRGIGMCVEQSSVYGALLAPFSELLGIDAQYRTGHNFRGIVDATSNVFGSAPGTLHGWWHTAFRPSGHRTVTDRTWRHVNLPLDRAVGFPGGDRYPSRAMHGYEPAPLLPTDVNLSGDVSAATVERQFPAHGDGRENHMSLVQNAAAQP